MVVGVEATLIVAPTTAGAVTVALGFAAVSGGGVRVVID